MVLILKMFKDSVYIVQVSSDDALVKLMKPSSVPRLVWVKDLTLNLIEEY